MNYEVIATGSKGNCVVISEIIAIDLGVPFSALRKHYRQIQLVLLTHEHGDHFNRSTIRKLSSERPTIRWGVPPWLVADVSELVDKAQVDVITPGKEADYCLFTVKSFPLVHDVPNCAYLISYGFGSGVRRVFYATDTNTLDHVEVKNADLYLVEGNYREADIAERIRHKQETGEHIYEWNVLKNHLSVEKAERWLANNAGENSKYVLMHEHQDGAAEGKKGKNARMPDAFAPSF